MTRHVKDPFARAEASSERIRQDRAARRAEKKAQMQAAAAERWADRDGKARPTPERRAKGAFVLRDGEAEGESFAVDEAATVLDRLAMAGVINEDQRQGGIDLAMVLHRTRLGHQGRSCCDFTPTGYQDDEPETHQQQRDRQQRAQVYASCRGPWVWPELYRVCGEDQQPRHIESLRAGLDVCVKVFGR